MTASASPRSAVINLRARPTQRELLDRACQATQRSLTEFVLDAACREAERVICDRRYFSLDGDAFDAFAAALDAPLHDNPAIRRLLARKAPWED